jgi:predicted deacetylase
VLELETAQTSLAATCDKLDSKLKTLNFQVIRADEAVLRLKNAERQLKAVGVGLEDFVQARKLLQHDDFLDGGPCCGTVQESSS